MLDRMTSIELAIRNERTEMEYYLEQARRSKNPVAKLLFETLAADEKEHMVRIEGLHRKLTADGAWPDDLPIEVAGTEILGRVNKLMEEKDTSASHDDDDIAALEKAAKGEADGSRFYKELAQVCDNQKEKKFFEFLAKIEREHLLSIQDSLFYLRDPDAWFEEKGRSSFDGG